MPLMMHEANGRTWTAAATTRVKVNDDHNPDRVKPRTVLNLGVGSDNLFHTEKTQRWTTSISVDNLTNKVALYKFLSTFSGTHFIQPRTVVAKIGFVF
jgi:hypothetical protein